MKKLKQGAAVFLLLLLLTPLGAAAPRDVIVGGDIIGIRLETDGVAIVEFSEKAPEKAGLCRGDILKKVDGVPVSTAEEVKDLVDNSSGEPLRLTVERKGREKSVVLAPTDTGAGKKLGILVRDQISGIGTVTYYEPETDRFGALGHGVSGEGGLVPMREGQVLLSAVRAVEPSRTGAPGSLRGTIEGRAPCGEIEKNSEQGIFGRMEAPREERLPVAPADSVHTGPAKIRCTLEGREIQDYDVQILAVYSPGEKTRNLLLEVTDPTLLEAAGGIVQGMSGSPILQDGRLAGAVTHVLIDNPAQGYGIFIENMLNAA